jgi:hypothetical protein
MIIRCSHHINSHVRHVEFLMKTNIVVEQMWDILRYYSGIYPKDVEET